MTMCERLADSLELIAAGELTPDAEAAAHLSACPACARAVDIARQIDGLLRSRAVPPAPAQFTSRVTSHIRRATWRREQIVDWIFNAAMIAAALVVVAALGVALQRTGVSFVGKDAMQIFSSGMLTAAQKVAPSLPLYGGATCLLAVALGLWWWASDSAAL